jgi:hypothetical protein
MYMQLNHAFQQSIGIYAIAKRNRVFWICYTCEKNSIQEMSMSAPIPETVWPL